MEIMFVDGYLVIHRCQTVGLSDAIGDKRGIAHATGHVAFVTREHQHVVEVEVSGF